MQTEKSLINDLLCVSKTSRKFCILTIYNFVVIYLWNLQFSQQVAYLLTVSTVFSVYKQNFMAQKLEQLWMPKFQCVICVEAIIYSLL